MLLCLTVALTILCSSMAKVAMANGSFYISSKVILAQQRVKLGAPALKVFNPDDTASTYWFRTGLYKGLGMSPTVSMVFGAASFGYDFYPRFRLPVRLELELSTSHDNKSNGRDVYLYGEDPNTILYEIDQNNVFNLHDGFVKIYNFALAHTVQTAFVNIYVDWQNNSRIKPFVGVGLGAAFVYAKSETEYEMSLRWITETEDGQHLSWRGRHIDPKEITKNVTQFAWHLDAGLAIVINEIMTIELSYRYLDLGNDLDLSNITHVWSDLSSLGPDAINFEPTHQAILGIRFAF
jgi:opacity protein-like surface antigen